MKPEEAIKRINEHITIHRYNEPHAIRIAEALQMAIEALEKQVPKKPLMEFYVNQTGDIGKKCVCGMFVSNYASYCENCGQRIKR